MIRASDISFGYDGAPVLAGVSLAAERGGLVGLIGPNGSGKTTLLRILYTVLRPHAGLVTLDDVDVSAIPGRDLARRIAVVAQESPSQIPISVAEMVLLGRSPHRSPLQPYTAQDHRIAAAALRRVGLRELADRDFTTLSGGERQRALIARALTQEALQLLLDEPTNHLDIHYQHEILDLVRSLGVTTVVVLHDLNLAARYCEHLVLLHQGTVAKAGPTADVLRPEVLEPVYRVDVRALHDDVCVQLIFRPAEPKKAGCRDRSVDGAHTRRSATAPVPELIERVAERAREVEAVHLDVRDDEIPVAYCRRDDRPSGPIPSSSTCTLAACVRRLTLGASVAGAEHRGLIDVARIPSRVGRSPGRVLGVVVKAQSSMVTMAQQKPASSCATAIATSAGRLPLGIGTESGARSLGHSTARADIGWREHDDGAEARTSDDRPRCPVGRPARDRRPLHRPRVSLRRAADLELSEPRRRGRRRVAPLARDEQRDRAGGRPRWPRPTASRNR